MLKPRFDFDAAFDRATQLLTERGLEDRLDLHKSLMRREAAVARMACCLPMSSAWEEAAKAVLEEELTLAPHGLV